MPVIEILAYTYNNRDEFRRYCIEGKPNGMGGHHTDPQGRKITGVLDWLRGRGVPEAHFFRSEKPTDRVQLFAATIERKENYDVPWMGNVPGFEAMVNVEGLIGKTDSFASFTDLVASVKPDTEMDDLYKKRRDNLDALLIKMAEKPDAMPTVGKQRLLAALRGELGSNADEVFEEVEKRFPDTLFRM